MDIARDIEPNLIRLSKCEGRDIEMKHGMGIEGVAKIKDKDSIRKKQKREVGTPTKSISDLDEPVKKKWR